MSFFLTVSHFSPNHRSLFVGQMCRVILLTNQKLCSRHLDQSKPQSCSSVNASVFKSAKIKNGERRCCCCLSNRGASLASRGDVFARLNNWHEFIHVELTRCKKCELKKKKVGFNVKQLQEVSSFINGSQKTKQKIFSD